jgi:hypothetical protein
MTDKTFTRAGISTLKGKTLYRFTNDLQREKVLHKNGHTDIVFFELGEAMTKEAAALFLAARGIHEDAPAKPVKAAKEPTRKDDERILTKLAKGEVEYDESSDKFLRLVAEKRQSFPSHTDEQLMDLVRFQAQANMKAFGDLEPNF